MRHIFLIFLALSFPAMAQEGGAPQVPQPSKPGKKVEEPKALCNPQEETKMPETFY